MKAPILSSLDLPGGIRTLPLQQKHELAQELRDAIISVSLNNGGHLAASLGVVELTIALHMYVSHAREAVVL